MDLGLLLRALGRHKLIFGLGLFLACGLAVLAMAKVSFAGGKPKLTYRSPVVYSATTVTAVTQSGFPWGLAVLPQSGPDAAVYGDPSRFATLASFYATLANSDVIQRSLNLKPRLLEGVTATAAVDPNGTGQTLPFVDITGYATDPRDAVSISIDGAELLKKYVEQQQREADLPTKQRAVVQIIQSPKKVGIALKRKKTTPILVFMTVMLATFGIILALENLARSRREREESAEVTELPELAARPSELRAGRELA